ncbi:MAG: hypothetical protein CL933_12770 [Deltaproteobacteria bacterium]|nr:hypothetical protein [Deltaproteobacteria bacterium]
MIDSELSFTGERLHEDEALFGIDLLRHLAAYQEAIQIAHEYRARDVLELGSGTGYGTRTLAEALPRVVAIDRVAPLAAGRESAARFLRADLEAIPLEDEAFDLVVSFQVIEHLADPTNFLDALARPLRTDGVALLSTPNRTNSDGENPFHLHEYEREELRTLLETRFESVEIRGVSARGEALRYHEERLRRIRRILRIDPLGLRRWIPRALVEWLFARLALVVRRRMAAGGGMPRARPADFLIEGAHPASLDLFAVCRGPRRARP